MNFVVIDVISMSFSYHDLGQKNPTSLVKNAYYLQTLEWEGGCTLAQLSIQNTWKNDYNIIFFWTY